MTYTKRLRTIVVSVLSALCLFMMALGCFAGGFFLKASAESATQAYLLNIDRTTKGQWYYGKKGTKEFAENRYYGKEGVFWPLGKVRADGQPFQDVEQLNDTSVDSIANIVELPSYVSGITSHIQSYNDMPHGYWNNNYGTLDNLLAQGAREEGTYKRLLPMEWTGSKYEANTATWLSQEDIIYDVHFNDDEWHKVSFYLLHSYYNNNLYAETEINILDTNGNVISKDIFTDANVGGWVTYAIKGSFTIRYVCNGQSGFQMIAFDKFEERDTIGTSNFSASREGAQTISLSWENKLDTSVTNIYRREKGAQYWNLLGSTAEGANSYADTSTNVSTEYEYMLSSGTLFTETRVSEYWPIYPTVFDGNLPDETNIVSIRTAPYDLTKIEFEKSFYSFGTEESWEINATVKVQNRTTNEYEPYAGATVKFSLDGERVYTTINGEAYANMNTDLGSVTADANGKIQLTYTAEYPGEYIINAVLNTVPNAENPEYGTAKTSSQIEVSQADEETAMKPYLMSITDAIKPGDTVTISGNFISYGNTFKVAYAPNTGSEPATFDEDNPPQDVEYFAMEDLMVTDTTYNSGVMFTFPAGKTAGSYDFWIKNGNGWSNGITLNAARPLYINQDTAYAGLPIEIVGRNFLVSDFGIGTQEAALNAVKVKLVPIDTGTEYVLPVLTGVRYQADESATGEAIMNSHPFRLTFITPDAVWGGYKIYVAADGKDFRLMESTQILTIEEKKAANWDETVFGTKTNSSHIGNDPLDLQVGWAQNLNYADVRVMTPNEEPGVAWDKLSGVVSLTNAVQTAINDLSAANGGVVYFPEGTYHITGITLKNNVMLVGAGKDKTKILCVNTGVLGTWIKQDAAASNIGVARIGFGLYEYSSRNPDWVLALGEGAGGVAKNNVSLKTTANKFISDCDFTFRWEMTYTMNGVSKNCRAVIEMNAGKNILYQNNTVEGCSTGLYGAYHNEYAIARNSRVHMDGIGMTFSLTGSYTFIENIYLKSNDKGHGFALRNNAYISDCFITKTGSGSNNGEMIMFEPPYGYFSAGYILDADARSFTIAARDNGTLIRENTRLDYNNFAVYISEGKGAGQLRYFKNTPTNSYGNQYELADNEQDWDIIPDSTSVFSIICPMEGATVYRIHGTDCNKAIFLYTQMFDAVVAECNLWETEGIAVFSGDVNDSRFCPSRGIRIENNRIDGISPKTGKGGIFMVSERSAARASNGAQLMNIVVRGNTLTNTRLKDGTTYDDHKGASETPKMHGIIVWTHLSEGLDTAGDARFIIIEGNSIDNSEYGIWCDNRITGIVIRNNTIGKTDSGVGVTFYTPTGFHLLSNHTLYVDGAVSELSGEYAYNADLPTLADKDGKVFVGWSLTEEYDAEAGLIVKGLDTNTTLYAMYGRQVTFDLGYTKKDGTSIFNTIKVMDGETVETAMTAYGDPFRIGYEFGGWYLDEACTQAFDASQAINSNLKVYAKWIGDEEDPNAGNTGENGGCAGCNGSIGGASAFVGILGLAGMAILRKKRK